VTERVPARNLVGAGGVKEVPGEGTQLRSVEIALVVHRHGVPARGGIHAPAEVAHRVGLAIAPSGEVAPHQLRIDAVPSHLCYVVSVDRQAYGGLEVSLERQVDVAA